MKNKEVEQQHIEFQNKVNELRLKKNYPIGDLTRPSRSLHPEI